MITGKTGQKDWNQDGSTSSTRGMMALAWAQTPPSIPSECYGPQTTTYLQLTMQHACLAATASGKTDLLNLFNKIKTAGANIAQAIASIQSLAQKIARSTDAGAFSQDEVNTLVETADVVLNGRIDGKEQQYGARQLLSFSEEMATITVYPV